MRLPRPFHQLPFLFDAARLRAEIAALPADAWVPQAQGLGADGVGLICAGGTDIASADAPLMPSRWLDQLPYVRQVLAGLGVVWSRTLLMRLAPTAGGTDLVELDVHFHTRVRLHVPIVTTPDARFECGGATVHMEAGEAWMFDDWRRHRFDSATRNCVHLVADTSGTAAFWQLALGCAANDKQWRTVIFQPGLSAHPLIERSPQTRVMPSAEVHWLIGEVCSDLSTAGTSLETRERGARACRLLESFVQDWRQLCALHGTDGRALPEFRRLAAAVRTAARPLAEGLSMPGNGVPALRVLEARVLNHLIAGANGQQFEAEQERLLDAPVFIVAAPRSGSTLLFETLASSSVFNTLGGEAHWLIENFEALRPGAPGVDSNRLSDEQATPEVCAAIRRAVCAHLRGPGGRAPSPAGRFLEKTPKNSLRIPFLKKIFPDARFIFLWRDPRDNLSSIMEAWRSGDWITYASLAGWDGPWSLLLPPGWQALRGAPAETIAARQWQRANEIALADLARMPSQQWTSVAYHDLLAAPAATIRRLCAFLDAPFDGALQARTAGPLPQSRSTHTPPAPDKWRRNQAEIDRVLPSLTSCWQRLQALG